MRPRVLLWGLWLACATGCVGISLRPRAMDEAVRIQDVALSFTQEGAGRLWLRLEVENPTFWDGVVKGVDYRLTLDGREFAVGTRKVEVALASDAKHTLEVTFPLRVVPPQPQARPRSWQVEVGGGVALAFGETVRVLPFRVQRFIRLESFRFEAAPQ